MNSKKIIAGTLILPFIGCTMKVSQNKSSSLNKAQSKAFGLRPNVLFILVDDMGYADMGAYSSHKVKNFDHRIDTPNMDKLAAGGMKFTQFYSGAPVCAPSRNTLLTGKHTGNCTIRDNGNVALKDGTVTVGHVMKRAGYKTATIGKWGNGDMGTTGMPLKQGFDYFYGFLNQTEAHYYYNDRMVENNNYITIPENQNGKRGLFLNDAFTHKAKEFINDNKNNPFFLQLWYTVPHAGLETPQESVDPYVGKWGPETPYPGNGHYPAHPTPHAAYAGMITRMDSDIGQIVKQLENLGIANNTLIVFMSDNGSTAAGGIDYEFFNGTGPFRDYKFSLYEGGLRVPFMAYWPGKIKPGQVNNKVFAGYDFLPTMAELAGEHVTHKIDGVSIAREFLGESVKGHEYLYFEKFAPVFKQAIRYQDWKGVRLSPTSPLELYNLRTDIGETKNIAANHPDIVQKLEGYMKVARTPSPDFPVPEIDNVTGATEGDDVIDGTVENDEIKGLGGNDTIRGLGGDDFINGNMGNDNINGNVGNDTLRGGKNDDMVRGGKGNDKVYGDLGNDTLYGDLGNDELFGGDGNDTYFYRSGDGYDVIFDGGGNDTLECPGLENADISRTRQGNDLVLNVPNGSITIKGYYLANKIENIKCGGGSSSPVSGGSCNRQGAINGSLVCLDGVWKTFNGPMAGMQCNACRCAHGRIADGTKLVCLADSRTPTGFAWASFSGPVRYMQCNKNGGAEYRQNNQVPSLYCRPFSGGPTGWAWQ